VKLNLFICWIGWEWAIVIGEKSPFDIYSTATSTSIPMQIVIFYTGIYGPNIYSIEHPKNVLTFSHGGKLLIQITCCSWQTLSKSSCSMDKSMRLRDWFNIVVAHATRGIWMRKCQQWYQICNSTTHANKIQVFNHAGQQQCSTNITIERQVIGYNCKSAQSIRCWKINVSNSNIAIR
jgi:hypothetical protein